jgi:hypothetical protein
MKFLNWKIQLGLSLIVLSVLLYALNYLILSDVNVKSGLMRRTVLIHSLVSFFFYSMVLTSVLNAIITF